MTTKPAAPTKLESLIGQLRDLGNKYIEGKDYTSAQLTSESCLSWTTRISTHAFVYAHLIEDGTHKKHAEARDLLLSILDDRPEIYDDPTEGNLQLIRGAAERCSNVGPIPKRSSSFAN